MTSSVTSHDASQAGVLLVGHGTRDKTGTQQFFQLGKLLSQTFAPTPVVPCLLEFQEPTIPQAWQQLVDQGVERILVAPLLLFAAGHAKRDIPELIEQCRAALPHIETSQTGPLSRHPSVVDLLVKRIQSSASECDPSRTALVMVGRGSHDPCAQADMRVMTEVVARKLPYQVFTTGFYAMAEPKLPKVLDRVAQLPDVDHVIVQPHLLFQGRLFQAIERQVAEASGRHGQTKFVTSGYLGPTQQVADAIATRLQSAWPSCAEQR